MIKNQKDLKLTPKQKEIVKFMQDGYPLFTGISESNGRQYYMIGGTHNKGFGNTYFNTNVFGNLLSKKLIQQMKQHPYDWELTDLGDSLIIK
jgi:hypothetical protein